MIDIFNSFFTWQGQQTGVLIYLGVIFIIAVSNALVLRRLGAYPPPPTWPRAAVLVPARNEETNIARCINSLLAQNYPDFTVWVLDDHSTDDTPAILETLAGADERLHVLSGAPLPPAWLGKPWACQQLADALPLDIAVIAFVDADTWHEPSMLRKAVAALEAERADLVSVIPDEVMITLAEKLSVPLIPWSLLTHFPLVLARLTNWPPLATAIGQMMLFRRSAYIRLGGHVPVREEVAEDMALAREIARQGGRWRLLDGGDEVHCRMYSSFDESLNGFGKNLYAVFGRNLALYLFVWLWLGIAFLSPWFELLWTFFVPGVFSTSLALIAILLATSIWGLYAWRLRSSPAIAFYHPVIIAVSFLLAFHSLGQHITGRAAWKGRRV